MNNLVLGCTEAIDQAIVFIESIDNELYRNAPKSLFESSIGQHVRHTLDMFAVLRRTESGEVNDYDLRRRGTSLEFAKHDAINEFKITRRWLAELTEQQLASSIEIKTEIGLREQLYFSGSSTLSRELVFVSSHLVHHMAIMAAIAKHAGIKVDPAAGVAAATASYLREIKSSA